MISFLIPFRTDHSYRENAYTFVLNHLLAAEALTPSQILTADKGGDEFDRSGTRNQLAAAAEGDVLVFVDADSYVPAVQLHEAIYAVRHGLPWSFPYDKYCSLTQHGTGKFLQWIEPERSDLAYVFPSAATPEASVGGCVVISREAFLDVGGYDERFSGWGEEDRAFALACGTLLGPETTIPGPLYHLWHPAPESSRFEHPSFMDNRVLCNRYREASGQLQTMRSLVDEHR